MTASLAYKVYPAEQVRQHEPRAASNSGASMYQLMQRAGLAAFELMRQQWPKAASVLVVTGGGNNGGDGYVLAHHCLQSNIPITLCAIEPDNALSGDAATARSAWLDAGGEIHDWQAVDFSHHAVLVDALLGTGLKGSLRSPYDQLISKINQAESPVLSIDIPSGIHADSGAALGNCVLAQHTITFVAIKPGLVTSMGRQACGKLHLDDLQVGDAFEQLATASAGLSVFSQLPGLPARAANSHKGDYGRLLCIGGDHGMAGAIRLAGESALRCGAGLVKIYCHGASVIQVANGRPELMVDNEHLEDMLNWSTVILLGPGLGKRQWGNDVFMQVLEYLRLHPKPLLLDADGLNLAARHQRTRFTESMIITPHPGEAARLLATDIQQVEQQRYQSARQLAHKLSAVCVLKGAGTLVDDGSTCNVITQGNPGMATAGMGDVLSGICGALLAQGLPAADAALYAASLHAACGDKVAQQCGQRGILASDLFPFLRQLINS